MKKQIIFFISVLVLVGCYDEQDKNLLSLDSDLSIAEAQSWFTKNFDDVSSARLSNDRSIYKKAY